MMNGSWDIKHDRQKFLSFWPIFCPLTLLTTQKIKILNKMKNIPGYIIILHMSTINQNHMMYDSWDMEHERQNFSHFGPFFALYTPSPPNNPKNQNFQKLKKNPRDIIILHKCTINDNHMIYGSWDINCNRDCHLGPFLPFYPPNSPKNWNVKKNLKKPGDIIILHKCTKNHGHMLYCSWEFVCDRFNYISFWAIFYPFTPHPPKSPKNRNITKMKKMTGDTFILH